MQCIKVLKENLKISDSFYLMMEEEIKKIMIVQKNIYAAMLYQMKKASDFLTLWDNMGRYKLGHLIAYCAFVQYSWEHSHGLDFLELLCFAFDYISKEGEKWCERELKKKRNFEESKNFFTVSAPLFAGLVFGFLRWI